MLQGITMIRNKLVLLMLALSFPSLSCSHAPAYKSAGDGTGFYPSAGQASQKVHRYRLSNGLKVLILEDHTAPTFAYQTWFKVGSKDEEKGLTGLAHLFEHMMFKETKNRKDG